MLFCALLCYAILCFAMLCYAMLYYTILYYTIGTIHWAPLDVVMNALRSVYSNLVKGRYGTLPLTSNKLIG